MGCIAPSDPKGVVADAISSSTTGQHAACTWCSDVALLMGEGF